MPKGFAIVLCLMLGASAPAFAQASPVSEGPIGTPITPSQLGGWNFSPGINKAEAAEDAREQGFAHVAGLREDDYGDWIGHCDKGQLIVFPRWTGLPAVGILP